MTYNIHPILVHFPIALLFVYAIIKVLPLSRWFPNVAWKQIQRAFLGFGVLGAFAALSTGEIAEQLARPDHKLVETHAFFATTSTWIFGLLLLGEILSLVNISMVQKLNNPTLTKFSLWLEKLLTHPALSKVLAAIGFITISITGMLGGAMVYGTSADPAAATVLKILGITI